MTALAEFLLARIAEDEAVAQAVDSELSWGGVSTPAGVLDPEEEHIARWDPARVLAECDAKRRIVEAEPERWVLQPDAPGHTIDMGTPDGMVRVYGKLLTWDEYRDRYMELAPPSQTLLYLAMPYADHPDYREEWRP